MKKRFPLSVALVFAVILSASYSVWLEGRQAERVFLRYIGIWETEIARSLLMHERSGETAKLLAQIEEVHPALRVMSSGENCEWPVRRTISLYALPARDLVVCRDSAILVAQGLLSPSFFGLLLAVVAFLVLFWRREHRLDLLRLSAEARAEFESRLGQLSREVAHDIRGPLTALQMLVSNAKSLAGPEREMLKQASSRINAIADELLQRSRKAESTSGISEPHQPVHEAIALDGAIFSLVDELKQRFPSSRLDLSLQSDGTLIMSETILQRVISNLVQNAVDASPEGGRILIATRAFSNAVTVVISDEGKGISPELLARLGREEVTSGKQNGNGLGVVSARRAIESVGGVLTIQSKEGVGTQVELRFPR